LAALLVSLFCTQLCAEQLRVLTSMPPGFYQPFMAAFSKQHPDVEVITLNKNTNASVDEILRDN
jgi:hypothetical protein